MRGVRCWVAAVVRCRRVEAGSCRGRAQAAVEPSCKASHLEGGVGGRKDGGNQGGVGQGLGGARGLRRAWQRRAGGHSGMRQAPPTSSSRHGGVAERVAECGSECAAERGRRLGTHAGRGHQGCQVGVGGRHVSHRLALQAAGQAGGRAGVKGAAGLRPVGQAACALQALRCAPGSPRQSARGLGWG